MARETAPQYTAPGVSRRGLLGAAGAVALTGALSACTRHSSSTQTASGSSPASGSSAFSGPSSAGPPNSASATASSGPAGPSLRRLSGALSRPLLLPASAGYAGAARLYNARFDSSARPAAIALPQTAADVAACVRYAGASGSPIALRGGGHSYGGWSTGPGLVVNYAAMTSVAVDTAAGLACIGAGANLAQVYSALSAKGVALAGGSCPTVGIAGLAMGGGIGVLSRAYGLTCDAVRSVQIVTADGRLREVSAKADPDLFWALRGGGGGSFGAATAFTIQVRPAPTVHTFFLEWDFAAAAEVLSAWQRWIAKASPLLWSTCKLLADPPSGSLHATVSGTWIGSAPAMTAQLATLRNAIGHAPTASAANSLSYGQAMLLEAGCYGQSAATCIAVALSPAKRQPFAATSAVLAERLPAAGISAAVASVRQGLNVAGMVEGGVSFDALGAAVDDVAAPDTAFVHRGTLAFLQYTATWPSAQPGGTVASAVPFDAYVRRQRATLLPFTGPSAYVNYADPAITDYGPAYWGANYTRLQGVKQHYDPANLFTFAQAVRA